MTSNASNSTSIKLLLCTSCNFIFCIGAFSGFGTFTWVYVICVIFISSNVIIEGVCFLFSSLQFSVSTIYRTAVYSIKISSTDKPFLKKL